MEDTRSTGAINSVTNTYVAGLLTAVGAVLVAVVGFENYLPGATTPGSAGWLTFYGLLTLGALALLVGAVLGYPFARASGGRIGLAGVGVAALGFAMTTFGSALNLVYAGPAGETTTGGEFLFGGIVVAVLGGAILAAGLSRAGTLVRVAAALGLALVAFVTALVVELAFVDLFATFAVVFAVGWLLFGLRMRTWTAEATTGRTAPVA
ncbi:hypothetical protein [Halogeometricum limi]|uniref:Uncharacterized protein n=1 Tax=Halogeometricum limi TaxID=555875 RepID=A0A1I6GJ13_9EURY|nr:hypothetical protein [Halogeometricum limi]SFR42192.1 hypothetical protein SAMN04488124_1120 [Halogeometricum limi]